MASIQKINRKSGLSYLLTYYLNNKKYTKYYPPGIPYPLVLAEKKRIESQVTMHKSGLQQMYPEERPVKLTLEEFSNMILKARVNDVNKRTLDRNRYALKVLTRIIGNHVLVTDLKDSIELFRAKRLEEGASKDGINKDLKNVVTCLNAAVDKGIIDKNPLEKIKYFSFITRQFLFFLNHYY